MKRTIYKLFRSFIFISLVMCSLALVPFSKMVMAEEVATEEIEGLDFTDGSKSYTLGQVFKEAPATFEALVKINTKTKISNGRYGVIIGSFGKGSHTTNLEVKENGYPSLWYDGKTVLQGTKAINTGEWTHVAFVRDSVNSKVYCYINGEAAGEATVATKDVYPDTAFAVGMDNRGASTYPLQGMISTISISAKVKSQAEIKASMTSGIEKAGTNGVIYSASFADQVDTSVANAYYRPEQKYLETPNTFTATFKIPAGTSGRIGTIIGNYAGGYSTNANHPAHAINVEVKDNGQLRFYWDTGAVDVSFDAKDFRTGQWEHITVVRDVENGCIKLYDDGVLLQTVARNTGADVIGLYAPALGNDLRQVDATDFPFQGYIKDVAVYSTALTSEEVFEEYAILDKTTINKVSNAHVMFNWVFVDELSQKLKYDPALPKYVYDYSGNENHAYLATVNHFYDVEEDGWYNASNDEYTMIFYPDIQTVVSQQPQTLFKMNQWVADHASDMNLQMVLTLGDIIDGNATQWRVTRSAFEIFDEADIPYSLVIGNHDYDENALSANNGRNASNFNSYFKYETFVDEDYFVEAKVPGKMENACYTYSALGVNYLIFALEFGPSDSTLEWVSSVISRPEYNSYRVIVTSHSLVHSSGDFSSLDALHNPNDYGFVNAIGVDANTGQEVWDELLSKHDNIFMVASGHIINDTIMRRVDVGDYGNEVLSMLIDGQGVKDINGASGAPLLLVCKVNETTKEMTFNYYDPVNDKYFCVENQFTYNFANVASKAITASANVDVAAFAKPGETVEFTCDFSESSTLKSVIVKDILGNVIAVSENNGIYSFEMPEVSVSIETAELNMEEVSMLTKIELSVGSEFDLEEALGKIGFVYQVSNKCASVADGILTANAAGKGSITVSHPHFGVLSTIELVVNAHYCKFDQQVISDDLYASDATCAAPMQYYYSCTCGAVGTNTFGVGETLAHKYNQQVVADQYLAIAATCLVEGQYYYSCSCGAKGDATFLATELAPHTYLDDATCHAKECIVCHAVVNATTEHAFDEGVVTLEPSQVAEGVTTYTCEHCQETKVEIIEKTLDSSNTGCKASLVAQITTVFTLLGGALYAKSKKRKSEEE